MNGSSGPPEVTHLLAAWSQGDRVALEVLMRSAVRERHNLPG